MAYPRRTFFNTSITSNRSRNMEESNKLDEYADTVDHWNVTEDKEYNTTPHNLTKKGFTFTIF